VDRLAELEHDVVGDVDRERDRANAARRRRDAIHGGVGRVPSMPRTIRAVNTEQPARPRIGARSSNVTS
jgi:hypothetical protein